MIYEAQVLPLQTPEQAGEPSTYWSQSIRMMPLANIDPSLAIGFYCRTLGAASFASVQLQHLSVCIDMQSVLVHVYLGPSEHALD